jgi:hypothetical protein
MAGTPSRIIGPQPVEQTQGDLPQDTPVRESLADLLNPPEPEPAPAATAESASGTTQTPTQAPASNDIAQIMERMSKLEDDLTAQKQLNTYLQGRIAERQQPAPVQPVEQAPQEFTFDENAVAEEMQTNAPKALLKVVKDYLAHELKNVKKEAGSAAATTITAAQRQQQIRDAYQRDISEAKEKYGHMFTNKEFNAAADEVIMNIIRLRGGSSVNDYMPGDIMSAASRVYGEWLSSGKIKPQGTNGNSQTVPPLREVARRPFGDLESGNGASTGQRSGPAKTINDLFSNDRDRRIAREVYRQTHEAEPAITEERWVASYLRAKQNDDSFDR